MGSRLSDYQQRLQTQEFRRGAGIFASCVVCGCKSGHLRLCKLPDYAALKPWLAAFPEGLQIIDFVDAFRLSKKPDIGNGYSPSADSRSKIGDMCGDFRAILLAKSLPYANERPGGTLVARPVSECKTRKSAFMHFFDTLKPSTLSML